MPPSRLQRLVPGAQAALYAVLDADNETPEPPIRSEIFGLQRFAQHGKSLGLTHQKTGLQSGGETFAPRLRSNIARLRTAYAYIGTQAHAGYDISPAAEWLLENFHLLEAQFKEVFEGMPREYYRTLPVIVEPPLAGLPRVYAIAWAFVAHTDGAFNDELLVRFLHAYQESCILNLNELWALPTTLRVVLMENMRRLAERVATNKAARELANICCDTLQDFSPGTLDQVLALLVARGAGPVFLAQMVQRLQDTAGTDSSSSDNSTHSQWLQTRLPDPVAAQAQISADQAADNLSVSNAVTSLRTIGDADWPDLVNQTSMLIRAMLRSAAFAAEQPITRDATLHAIERLAQRGKRSELGVAQMVLGRILQEPNPSSPAFSASYWLEGGGRSLLLQDLHMADNAARRWRNCLPLSNFQAWLGCVALLTAGATALLLGHSHARVLAAAGEHWGQLAWVLLVLVTLFPASEAVLALVNRMVCELATPRHLQRLAFDQGIPEAHRVLVVIPAMLSSPAAAGHLAHQLLLHYLANPEPMAQFALLTDWVDAPTASLDSDLPLLQQTQGLLEKLNAQYPNPAGQAPRFLLLHRGRNFCNTEQRWIGWERKRGKLELLVRALATGYSSDFTDLGPASRTAPQTRYILTLDSDTQLPPGRLRDLVGIAAHPMNVPVLNASGTRVVSGYGILQPRVLTPLPSTRDFSRYHWLFSGQVGVDPYSAPSSEVYQDLFGEGSFSGKGLLHVQAMYQTLDKRLPQGRVLSHDLLEGALARCATVTDISLIEDTPFHADVAAARLHRWTRGDWQLLPLVLSPRQFAMGAVNRWKMLDNLRRSLVAPMSMLLVLAALCSHAVPLVGVCLLVFAAWAAGPLMGALVGLVPMRSNIALVLFYSRALSGLLRALLGGAWNMALLAQHAAQSVDAIGRALWRMGWSQRHLLEWTTAAAAQAAVQNRLLPLLWQNRAGLLVLAVLVSGLVAVADHPLAALLLCLLWAGSPVWTWFVSRPIWAMGEHRPTPEQLQYLHNVARDTWRYFEHSVSAADNHLPPDNLQVLPFDMLAHRTSPTNMGMYLLSAACARQNGWTGSADFAQRIANTLASMGQLQRHEGHFLNWYDTQTLQALQPMYVSTVDSGNLSAALLAVAQACLAFANPSNQASVTCTPAAQAIAQARQRLAPLLERRSRLDATQRAELRWLLADHRHTLRSHRLDHSANPAALQARLQALAAQLQALAQAPDFRFLLHRKRGLFHIGYQVASQQLDASFYDLLASESRLTSLVAIAKGDAPVSHWIALGRVYFARGQRAGLRSWSGSMFEYLMPGLLLEEPFGSALCNANAVALTEQIAFAKTLQLPWGISECAYAGRDASLAYQYAPQGVPRLALRRTPHDELVVAPYASALAAMLDPLAACANLEWLQALGARQRYGFIEALDYSPARQVAQQAFTPVATFMAHHQGMTIVALTNVLHTGVVRQWGMANAALQAIASLLHERSPREVTRWYEPGVGPPEQTLRQRQPGLLRNIVPNSQAVEPTHLLSNGRYNVALRANGAGHSRLQQVLVNRSRDDALRDSHGHFVWVRLAHGGQALYSVTRHPAADPQARYSCSFHADRVIFVAEWPGMRIQTTVWVSPEDDIEFRQIEVINLGDTPLALELVSVLEPTLTLARSDEAHPAFSNMFVSAEWQPQHQALVFERKARTPLEQNLLAAHFVAESDAALQGVRICTDRLRWAGRSQGTHMANLAEAAFTPAPASTDDNATAHSCDTGLDPVAAIAVRLDIAANSKACLTFATAAAHRAEALHACVDKYRQGKHIERSSLMSATLAGIRLRELRTSSENFATVQTLGTALLLQLHKVHRTGTASATASPASPAAARLLDRRLLWPLGISGDHPVVLVTIGLVQGLGLVRSLAQCMRAWAWACVACDVVVLNTEAHSYHMPLQNQLQALLEKSRRDCANADNATRLHLVRSDALPLDTLHTLRGLARLHLHADGRPLAFHTNVWADAHNAARQLRQAVGARRVRTGLATDADTGSYAGTGTTTATAATGDAGRFGDGGATFTFAVRQGQRPARPWANVLANPDFGCVLTESGGGYTWAGNSRLNQLTAWSNDAVADPCGEWFVVQDERSDQTWCITPNACADLDATYTVMHTQGHSSISHVHGHTAVEAHWCVDAHSAVKHIAITLTNQGSRSQHLRVVGVLEWIMGSSRADRASTWTQGSSFADGLGTVLTCTQLATESGFGLATGFVALAGSTEWTCDRRELLDSRGHLCLPNRLGQSAGTGTDPCAALGVSLELLPGEGQTLVFLVGHANSPAAAQQLAAHSAGTPVASRMAANSARWASLLGAAVVHTPDPAFDAMVNHWLLYQTVACRLWAKAAFYQAGGATGFRDQLQDAMALVWAAPELLRQQIVLSASRQFVQGDVQHWWHAPTGVGVRTHFSDDRLWLAHALQHYLQATGDVALLDQQVAFLEGMAIPEGAEDAYYTPATGTVQASVYEHAARAIDCSLAVGSHGLPLMGSGDWNDGMNRVGIQGRGESVWLAWFLCNIIPHFVTLARSRNEPGRALRWQNASVDLRKALQEQAWDGQWYVRAFFDDGQPLGAAQNAECSIDLMAQVWAVLSDAAPAPRQTRALDAVQARLVDSAAGLVRLLTPPLRNAVPDAGYIQSYPPGVRENGGQYAHAAVWAIMAQALAHRRGLPVPPGTPPRCDLAWQYFCNLSPAHRSAHPLHGPRYGLEPYALAGDVYSSPPYTGKGGWSWYTGAAGLLHRAALESIFGLEQTATTLCFTPCLPTHWHQAELSLCRGTQHLHFQLIRIPHGTAQVSEARWSATVLGVGELLHWCDLPDGSRFVIALPGV